MDRVLVVSRRAGFSAAALLLIFVQLVLGPVPTAAAHDEFLGSEPAASTSTPGPVTQIRLTFSQPPIPDFAAAQLTTPAQPPLPLAVHVEGAVLIADIPELVAVTEGEWAIAYRVVSADGHPVTGEIRFTVTRPNSSTPDNTSSQDASSTPTTSPNQPSGGSSSPPTRIIATVTIAGMAVAVLAIVIISRSRRRGVDREHGVPPARPSDPNPHA